MATVATLVAKLEADVRNFERGMQAAERRLDDLERSSDSASRSTDSLGGKFKGMAAKVATAGAVVGGAALIVNDMVGSFSDLEESINAVNVQFGEGADTILEFGETASTSVGLANSEFNQLSVVTGATLSAFIKDEQAVADETIRLTQRAADMASVFNTDVSDALGALQAGLRGETEPLRRFGVQLDDASVKARAVEMGLADTTAEVDMQTKRLAALDLIYEQTNKTAGDFANTSDSIANRQRILAAEFEDAKAQLGEALVPAMEAFLSLLEEGIPLLTDLAGVLATFVDGIVDFIKVIGDGESEFMRMKRAADENATSFEDVEEHADIMTHTMGDMSAAMERAETKSARMAREQQFLANDVFHTQRAIDNYTDSTEEATAAVDAQTLSLQELASQMAAQADPAVNLIQRTREYEAALATLEEMQASGTATAAELEQANIAVLEAWGGLIAAKGEVFGALDSNIQGFVEMARAAGIAEEDIVTMTAALFAIPTDIDISIHGTVSISGDIGDLETIIGAGGGGSVTIGGGGGGTIIGFHEGGVVPGPIGAPQLAVVHGGEVIANPHNPSALQMDSGGTTIVFEGPVMGSGEIERAVRAALASNGRRGGSG